MSIASSVLEKQAAGCRLRSQPKAARSCDQRLLICCSQKDTDFPSSAFEVV
jgi:hypothetical protein